MAIKIRSSRNPDVMDKNIQRLADGLNDLDVEIPEHTSSDAGKYLGVDSSGDLEFSDPLPAKTEASTGDVLGLTGEEKIPGWITPYTPPAYSTSEINTGQKWIDGKDVFSIVINSTTSDTAGNNTIINLTNKKLINCYGFISNESGAIYPLSSLNIRVGSPSNDLLITTTTGYLGCNYYIVVYYTKNEPEPEPENENRDIEETEEPVTKTTRRKTTK